jgi:hypothetical protein
MRLQLVGAPDIVDSGLADALALRHGPTTPVGHSRWFGLQRRIHDRGDFVAFIKGLSSTAWSNVPQAIQPLPAKALAPQNHRITVYRKLLSNRDIGLPRSGCHNDTAAHSHLLWCPMRCDPLTELLLFYR